MRSTADAEPELSGVFMAVPLAQGSVDDVIKSARALGNLVAASMELGCGCRRRALCVATMVRFDAPPVPSFEHRMNGNEIAILENRDLVGERMNFEGALLGGVGHAVGIAADADHSLTGGWALQAQNCAGVRVAREIAGGGTPDMIWGRSTMPACFDCRGGVPPSVPTSKRSS